MMQLKPIVKVFFCSLLIFGFAARGETQPVRVAVAGLSGDIHVLIAKERGYYRDEGLEPEVILMSSGVANQALIGGSVEFSTQGGTALPAVLRGAPIRFLLFAYQRPAYSVYSRKQIYDIKDLKGKTVGVSNIGSSSDFLLVRLLLCVSSPGEIHYRNLKYDEFDVFQMSISEFLMVKDRGNSKWRWSGLPVFLSKAFLWLNLYVNVQAGISGLGDLKGKRVGIQDYPMTAALWMRIFLKEFHGIQPHDITWFNGRTKEFSHGAIFELDRNLPRGVSIHWLTNEQTLDAMLDKGELDAAYGVLPRHTSDFGKIDRYEGTPVVGNQKLRKLFPDGGRKIITDYYERTGVLPSNHMYVVQSAILEKAPWVALELYKAFQRSKEVSYEKARYSNSAYMLFEGHDFKDQAETFGEDPYPLGVNQNRKMLEILFRGSYGEGLTRKLAKLEDIFYPTTLDT